MSDILRSRARRRDCFASSISLVAERPAALRATEVSVTGTGLEKIFCQGALTLAKPERTAMREIPMTPTRERQASLIVRDLASPGGEAFDVLPSNCPPVHQKPMSHMVVTVACSIHANRSLDLLLPVYSHPAADITEWISSEGMTTTKRSNNRPIVKWNAS